MGMGKINSADELYRSLRKWALPVIGIESVLRMDEGCNKAVKEVFVNLYNKGLIYRGELNHQLVSTLPDFDF